MLCKLIVLILAAANFVAEDCKPEMLSDTEVSWNIDCVNQNSSVSWPHLPFTPRLELKFTAKRPSRYLFSTVVYTSVYRGTNIMPRAYSVPPLSQGQSYSVTVAMPETHKAGEGRIGFNDPSSISALASLVRADRRHVLDLHATPGIETATGVFQDAGLMIQSMRLVPADVSERLEILSLWDRDWLAPVLALPLILPYFLVKGVLRQIFLIFALALIPLCGLFVFTGMELTRLMMEQGIAKKGEELVSHLHRILKYPAWLNERQSAVLSPYFAEIDRYLTTGLTSYDPSSLNLAKQSLDDQRMQALQQRFRRWQQTDVFLPATPIAKLLRQLVLAEGIYPYLIHPSGKFDKDGEAGSARNVLLEMILTRIIKESGFNHYTTAEEIMSHDLSKDLMTGMESGGFSYDFVETIHNQPSAYYQYGEMIGSKFVVWNRWDIVQGSTGPMYFFHHIDLETVMDALLRYASENSSAKLRHCVQMPAYMPDMGDCDAMAQVAGASISTKTEGSHVLLKDGNGDLYMWYGMRVPRLGTTTLLIGENVSQYLQELQRKLLIAFLLGSVLAILGTAAVFSLAFALKRPIQTLSAGVNRVRQGDLSQDLPVQGSDRLARLSLAFQRLLIRLRQSHNLLGFLDNRAHNPDSLQATVHCDLLVIFIGMKKGVGDSEGIDSSLSHLHDVLIRHKVRLDKFTGTALLASLPNQELQSFPSLVHELLHLDGGPYEIGITYGQVVQGHIGSPDRKDFTIIGEPVNLAARLQGLSDRVLEQSQIFLCEKSSTLLGDISTLRSIIHTEVFLKGINGKQKVREVRKCLV